MSDNSSVLCLHYDQKHFLEIAHHLLSVFLFLYVLCRNNLLCQHLATVNF